MIKVLYLGYYNRANISGFNSENWSALVKWFSTICTELLIYTECEIDELKYYFGKNISISKESNLDPLLNYKSYRMGLLENNFWERIYNYPFKFDNGITHWYFFNKDICIGSLELEDCDNYVFLNLTEDEEKGLIDKIPNISYNIKKCNERNYEIDYLLNNERWKALGVKGKIK